MTVYIDILFLLNFLCDFIILLSVSIILKRNVKISRIGLASLIGALSTFIIFIDVNNLSSLFIKIIFGSLIVVIAFKYKNLKYFFNNLLYFFINSVILGGWMYLVNMQLDNNFIKGNYYLNYIILVIFSPLIIYIYTRACLKLKNNYSLVYAIDVYVNDKVIKLNGFYDTGNHLIDPYKKRPIIIADESLFKKIKLNYILVPCSTIKGRVLLKCFKPNCIYIKGYGWKDNILIGLDDIGNSIEGINSIINKKILEDKI